MPQDNEQEELPVWLVRLNGMKGVVMGSPVYCDDCKRHHFVDNDSEPLRQLTPAEIVIFSSLHMQMMNWANSLPDENPDMPQQTPSPSNTNTNKNKPPHGTRLN